MFNEKIAYWSVRNFIRRIIHNIHKIMFNIYKPTPMYIHTRTTPLSYIGHTHVCVCVCPRYESGVVWGCPWCNGYRRRI